MSDTHAQTAELMLPQTTQTKAVAVSTTLFNSIDSFENAQRMAKSLAASSLVPKEYQNNAANTLIAMEYAHRLSESPFVIIQNLHVINGKPGLKSEYLILRINTSGRYATTLQFEYGGAKKSMQRTCTAWVTDKTGKRLEGTEVSMEMAKGEGWIDRTGSKWKTMPDQMLAYRAATFFQRLHCPDIAFGVQTVEEVIDITHEVVEAPNAIAGLNNLVNKRPTINVTLTKTGEGNGSAEKDKVSNESII